MGDDPAPEPETAASGGWGWGSSLSSLAAAATSVADGATAAVSAVAIGAQVVGEVAAVTMATPDEPTSFADTMKEARRVQENKDLAADRLAKEQEEAEARAREQQAADKKAAAELEKVIQAEVEEEDGDGWGWADDDGGAAADNEPAGAGDGAQKSERAAAGAGEGGSVSTLGAELLSSGMDAFSTVRTAGTCRHGTSLTQLCVQVGAAVAKNTVVGQMVFSGASKALNQSGGIVSEVGEGAFALMGALLAEGETVDLPAAPEGDDSDVDMEAMAEMRKTNLELHKAISEDMKQFLTANPGGTIQKWAASSEWTRDTGGERDATGAPVRVTTGIFLELFQSMVTEVAAAAPADEDGW